MSEISQQQAEADAAEFEQPEVTGGWEDWTEAVPTKQREGDQRLPQGGQECVQDLIIEKMEESKRVGMERYGSTLMTFNGRSTIQDIAEEARDLMVYLTQVEREARASRETLIEAVTEAFGGKDGHLGIAATALAETAVDRIMGWVVGQIMENCP